MKTFKKLATLSMALLFAFGLGALTACNGAKDSSTDTTSNTASTPASDTGSSTGSDEKTYTCYEFVVLDKDGNKVSGEGYQVNLCVGEQCYMPIAVVNGVCVYNFNGITAPGVYEAHVLYNGTQVELKEEVSTSADAWGEYTLQLKN